MSLDVAYRNVPIPVRVAQVFGIAASAFMSGGISSMTLYTVPALLTAPSSVAIKQWKLVFFRGAKSMPPLAILACASFGFLSWRDRHTTGPRSTLFLVAAILVPSIIPWTVFFMKPTNDALLKRAADAESESVVTSTTPLLQSEETSDKSAKALLDKWASLNLVRGVITGVASVLGIWAVLGDTKEMTFDIVA